MTGRRPTRWMVLTLAQMDSAWIAEADRLRQDADPDKKKLIPVEDTAALAHALASTGKIRPAD